MAIENIPEIYRTNKEITEGLFVYDFKMTNDVVKTKVNLSMNMFSFLQVGKKQVHFADTSVAVNREQSLLIKNGNCLWTELLDNEDIYYCKLLFFSEERLIDFLDKYSLKNMNDKEEIPYFIIENDEYIGSFLNTLSNLQSNSSSLTLNMISVKFEEIMLYLLNKYGIKFEFFLHSLISKEVSPFKKIIESNLYSNLKLEEIAFLCNMSLSTFKRNFLTEYQEAPGKWLKSKRLEKAKEILQKGKLKPSEIYLDFGYNNLSNFSTAFKNEFGVAPKEV